MTTYKPYVKSYLYAQVEACKLLVYLLSEVKTGDLNTMSTCIEIINGVKELLQQGLEHADQMCPNCITPWKCNGPHIPPGIGRSYPGIYKALLKARILSPNPEKSVLTIT